MYAQISRRTTTVYDLFHWTNTQAASEFEAHSTRRKSVMYSVGPQSVGRLMQLSFHHIHHGPPTMDHPPSTHTHLLVLQFSYYHHRKLSHPYLFQLFRTAVCFPFSQTPGKFHDDLEARDEEKAGGRFHEEKSHSTNVRMMSVGWLSHGCCRSSSKDVGRLDGSSERHRRIRSCATATYTHDTTLAHNHNVS